MELEHQGQKDMNMEGLCAQMWGEFPLLLLMISIYEAVKKMY